MASPRSRAPRRLALVLAATLAVASLPTSAVPALASAPDAGLRLAQSPAADLLRGAGAPAEEPAAEEPEAPRAIPLPEVAARAEEARTELRKMRPLAQPVEAVREIERQIDERMDRVDEGLARTDEYLEDAPDLSSLRDLKQAWSQEEQGLSEWRGVLTDRATALENRLAEIADLRETWEATRKQARASDAPDALLQVITSVLADLDDTEGALDARANQVLSLQNRVGREEERVGEALGDVAEAAKRRRGALLERDEPPLWALPGARWARSALVPDLGATLREDLRRVSSYFALRGEGVVQQLLFLAATVALLFILRRRARGWRQEDTRLASAVIWEHPFSTALLLLILFTPWFHPAAPTLVRNAAGLLVLVPLLRLLPRLLPERMLPVLRVLAAFYVVDQLRLLWQDAPTGERLLFLAETGTAAALLLILLRPSRMKSVPRDTELPPGLSAGMRVAAVLLLASVAANVLGFVSLAKLLGQGVLSSAYAAVLLYGGLRVLDALARVVLESRATARLHMVRRHRALLERRVTRILGVLAVLTWAGVTLEAFSLRTAFVEGVAGALDTSFGFGSVSVSVGGLVTFAITVVAAIWISRSVAFVLEEDVFPRVTLQRGVPGAISATARYAILLGGFFLAVAAAGVDLERFTILAGALGVGIGFGLQNIVNNFVSGLILLYERPIQVGDAIQVGELFGEVRRIGIRSSTVRNWEGAEVIVPNADLISAQVTNWTLTDRHRRMTVKVGVAYGTDPERVLEILRRVARAHPEVLDHPEPFARFVGFGESSLDFELWAHTRRFEAFWPTVNDVILAVHAELRDAGIQIPFPQRSLHLKSTEPEAARLLRGSPASPPRGGNGGDERPAPPASPAPGAARAPDIHSREEDS